MVFRLSSMTWAVQSFCVIFNNVHNLNIILAAIGVFKVTNTKKQKYDEEGL